MVAPKLTFPTLCLVTSQRYEDLGPKVEEAVLGGVAMVQIRAKELPGGDLLTLACELRRRIGGRALMLVNGRADVALAAGADGVHLGEEGLSVAEARRIAGPDMLVGRSVHSLGTARKAARDGADYLICGTIFETPSKPGKRPEGLDLLRQVAGAVDVPVLAIGGVDASNAASVIEAGAQGAAVISAILDDPDTRQAAMALRQGLEAPALRTARPGVGTGS